MAYTFLIIVVLIIASFFLSKPKFNRHKNNVRRGNIALTKVNSIEYDGQKINYLRKIDPFVFEELLLSAFKNKGFKIKRNKRYTNDGGIDGIIFNSKGDKILIQAKRYKSYINPKHVKEFESLVERQKCFGFFIHTGKTGTKSYSFNKSIKIISGSKLLELIKM